MGGPVHATQDQTLDFLLERRSRDGIDRHGQIVISLDSSDDLFDRRRMPSIDAVDVAQNRVRSKMLPLRDFAADSEPSIRQVQRLERIMLSELNDIKQRRTSKDDRYFCVGTTQLWIGPKMCARAKLHFPKDEFLGHRVLLPDPAALQMTSRVSTTPCGS